MTVSTPEANPTPDDSQPPRPLSGAERSRRSRARRNVVGRSAHREDYVRLLRSGCSPAWLEKYAAWNYGEDIPRTTFQDYAARLGDMPDKAKDSLTLKGQADPDLVDVITERAKLIGMQKVRLRIDVDHEVENGRLLPTTRHEVKVLSELLDAHLRDLQDVGLMPWRGQRAETGDHRAPAPAAEQGGQGDDVPAVLTLADVISGSPEERREAMREFYRAGRAANG